MFALRRLLDDEGIDLRIEVYLLLLDEGALSLSVQPMRDN